MMVVSVCLSFTQVAALGCKSFAVLFDDIDNEMLLVDAKEFPSFAHAQVVLTNDVYMHLGKPELFLFCPTGTQSHSGNQGWIQGGYNPFRVFEITSLCYH